MMNFCSDFSKNDKDYLTQDYLIEQYKIAKSDFSLADHHEKLISSLRDMYHLEFLATSIYGSDFCARMKKLQFLSPFYGTLFCISKFLQLFLAFSF